MRNLLYICLTAFFGSTGFAAPGITVANGGQSATCQGDGKYEAFDLFEGRVVQGFRYPSSVGDPKSFAERMALKLDANLANPDAALAEKVRHVATTMRASFDPLDPTGDSKEYRILPEGCSLVPTINFVDPQDIAYYHSAWEELDSTSRAALYLHEAVYWHLREGGVEQDSRRTRKTVAYLMSGRDLEPVDRLSERPARAQLCVSDDGTRFIAYKNRRGNLFMQFTEIGGYRMLTRTTVEEDLGPDLGDLPIDAGLRREVQITSQAKTVLDNELILLVKWGRGKVTLAGSLQYKSKIHDQKVKCTEVRL